MIGTCIVYPMRRAYLVASKGVNFHIFYSVVVTGRVCGEVYVVVRRLPLGNEPRRRGIVTSGQSAVVVGEVTPDKVKILQEADDIFITELMEQGLYDKVDQAFVTLLPVKTVGVMGDQRTYEYVAAIRSVNTIDFMTATWSKLPYEFLEEVSNKIINKVNGINRIVYDISSKPPGTIEWE